MTSTKKSIKNENNKTTWEFFAETLKMFLLAGIIMIPIRVFLFQPFIVKGASMEPNFHESDYLIVNEFGYKNVNILNKINIEPRKDLERGDIIVFRAPTKTRKEFYIKRIIGLPGETVEINNGKVRIYNVNNPSGFDLDESAYLPKDLKTAGSMRVSLKEDEYFVLGDNRNASSDSRVFGPINKNSVIGKTFVRLFPFDKIVLFD